MKVQHALEYWKKVFNKVGTVVNNSITYTLYFAYYIVLAVAYFDIDKKINQRISEMGVEDQSYKNKISCY